MKPPRTFPDRALCRTRHVYGEVYQCVADDACRCPYALSFAYSFYCKHPDCGGYVGNARRRSDGFAAGADEPRCLAVHSAGT